MKVYKYGESDLQDLVEIIDSKHMHHNGGRRKSYDFYNIACSFDIETSSFYDLGAKRGIMYIWQFGITEDYIVYGRTWGEYEAFLAFLQESLNLSPANRLIVYVHNLNFEFQFLKDLFEWDSVFAQDARKPFKALSRNGIEYKCSYMLSSTSLAVVARNLTKHKMKKLVGNLDYSLIRHSKTPLTEAELDYCFEDVRIVCAYIEEEMYTYASLDKIPLTSTGKVREYMRANCISPEFFKLMQYCSLKEDCYIMARLAFTGGHTHSCQEHAFQVMYNVDSLDFTSSYPTTMIAEMYPMGPGHELTDAEMKDYAYIKSLFGRYCMLLDVELYDVENTFQYDSIIPKHKCLQVEDYIEDNGKIYSAAYIHIVITDVDYIWYKKFYSFKTRFVTIIRYDKGYLPKELKKCILDLYQAKTQLKGVAGKEAEYQAAKGKLNSIYGMMVTDIHREEHVYENGEWSTKIKTLEEDISAYNSSKSRITSYLFGVWCSAYARANLWDGLYNVNKDVIYMDTDSLKIINREKHLQYFDNYNKKILRKLEASCKFDHLDISMLYPVDIKGITHPLGVWDYEERKGHKYSYDMFKTIGAKRYIYSCDGELSITIAGVTKAASKYLTDTYGDKVFDAFDFDLEIPAEYSGKLTHTYLDGEQHGVCTDYLGECLEYHERSGIFLEKTSYIMNPNQVYVDFLLGKRDMRI